MNTKRTCPNCRTLVPADAPEGVCPACALRAGFATHNGADSPTEAYPASGSPPMPADQLAQHLPELDQFELIGQGGMGAVYKARHRNLGRMVAVKVLDSALRSSASFADRFAREARTLAQLDHPNIVRVYDFGCRDDLYYLVMEFIDGVNLRQTLEAGALKPEQALAIVPHICDALQYAHDHGVVHRDIKPENVLVDRNGSIKIADFGLAKLVGGKGTDRLTQTRQVMGTPHYMAPEQIENPGNVDHRADIFALGVVFYELLTGELPVGRFPLPSRKVQIDVRFDEVVLRTLEKEPALRYQQASELKDDVQSVMRDEAADGVTSTVDAKTNTAGYEYRSKASFLGLPLIHIAFGQDPKGLRMRFASGIIAVGDVAMGAVAIGGFSFGLISIGGISVGLIGAGGIVLGLLSALGGVAIGAFPAGGLAIGLAPIGALSVPVIEHPGTQSMRTVLVAWGISTAGMIVGVGAGIIAWIRAVGSRNRA